MWTITVSPLTSPFGDSGAVKYWCQAWSLLSPYFPSAAKRRLYIRYQVLRAALLHWQDHNQKGSGPPSTVSSAVGGVVERLRIYQRSLQRHFWSALQPRYR